MRCHDPHAESSYPAADSGMRSSLESPSFICEGALFQPGKALSCRTAAGPSPRRSRKREGRLRSGRPVLPGLSLPASCMSFLHPVSFPSVPFSPPPGSPVRRDPDSRVMCASACARRRAFRGGAVCAPDCARAREGQTRGTPVPSVSQGSSRAGANRSGLRTPPRSGPYRHECFKVQAVIWKYFRFSEQICQAALTGG